jgi:hypothetical protein
MALWGSLYHYYAFNRLLNVKINKLVALPVWCKDTPLTFFKMGGGGSGIKLLKPQK